VKTIIEFASQMVWLQKGVVYRTPSMQMVVSAIQ